MTTPQSRWNKRTRDERKAKGLCPDCGAQATGYRCDKCKALAAAWQRKRRAEKKKT